MAVVRRIFTEVLGGQSATTFVGNKGELFFDPEYLELRISDGTTAGGQPFSENSISANGQVNLGNYYTRSQVDALLADSTKHPQNLSQFNNDAGFVDSNTSVSTFLNDAGYLTANTLGGVAISSLLNDAGYLTANTVTHPTLLSEFVNNMGFLTANTLSASGLIPAEQTISLSGNTITISGSNTSVDLSPILGGGAGGTTQTLSLTGNTITISGSNSSIDLTSTFSSLATDSQTLTLAGSNLIISGGNSVDLSTVVPTNVSAFTNDAGYYNASNLGFVNISTFVNDAGFITAADVTHPTNLSSFVNDAAFVNTSVLSTYPLSSFANDSGFLTANDVVHPTNLSQFVNDVGYITANNVVKQTLTFNTSNNVLTISGGNSVDLSTLASGTGAETQALSLVGNTVSISITNSSVDLTPLLAGAGAQVSTQLSDVYNIGSPTQGQVLMADANGSFFNSNLPAIDLSTHSINELLDVNTSAPAPVIGQILAWDGVKWAVTNPGSDQTLALSGNTITISKTNSTVDLTSLLVKPEVLSDLNDVSSSTPVSGQLLGWNGVEWAPRTFNESQTLSLTGNTVTISGTNSSVDLTPILGGTAATTLSALTDTNTANIPLASGQILAYNGAQWINTTLPTVVAGSVNLGDLANVSAVAGINGSTATASNGQVLTWNNVTNLWEPQTLASELPVASSVGLQLQWDGTQWSTVFPNAAALWGFANTQQAETKMLEWTGGGAIFEGAMFWDATLNTIQTYDGSSWSPLGSTPFINNVTYDNATGNLHVTRSDGVDWSVLIQSASLPTGTVNDQQLYWSTANSEWYAAAPANINLLNAANTTAFGSILTAYGETAIDGSIFYDTTAKALKVYDSATSGYVTIGGASAGGGFYSPADANVITKEVQYAEFDYTSGGSHPSGTITTRADGSDLVYGDKLQILSYDGANRANTENLSELFWSGFQWNQFVDYNALRNVTNQYMGRYPSTSFEPNPSMFGGSPSMGSIYYATDLGKYRMMNNLMQWQDLGAAGAAGLEYTNIVDNVMYLNGSTQEEYASVQALMDAFAAGTETTVPGRIIYADALAVGGTNSTLTLKDHATSVDTYVIEGTTVVDGRNGQFYNNSDITNGQAISIAYDGTEVQNNVIIRNAIINQVDFTNKPTSRILTFENCVFTNYFGGTFVWNATNNYANFINCTFLGEIEAPLAGQFYFGRCHFTNLLKNTAGATNVSATFMGCSAEPNAFENFGETIADVWRVRMDDVTIDGSKYLERGLQYPMASTALGLSSAKSAKSIDFEFNGGATTDLSIQPAYDSYGFGFEITLFITKGGNAKNASGWTPGSLGWVNGRGWYIDGTINLTSTDNLSVDIIHVSTPDGIRYIFKQIASGATFGTA